MTITLIALLWLSCAAFAYALNLGHFTLEFPYSKPMGMPFFCVLFGPAALMASLTTNRPLKLRWRPLSNAVRYALFVQTYGPEFRTYPQFLSEYGVGAAARRLRRERRRSEIAMTEAAITEAEESVRP